MKRMMMLFGMMLASCAAMAETEVVDGITWTYTVSNGTASVGGANPAIGDITIPATFGDYPVTSIGGFAFHNCSGLTSVTIPSSVTSIGNSVFCHCSGLTSVTIPISVTSIGERAFYCCSGLTSVTIPEGVTSIGNSVFYHCSGLTNVTIPDSVTSIGSYAFSSCSALTSATISEGVTSIGDYAFRGCSGLTSVTIPNSVTSIGGSAFAGCTGLTNVVISEGVTSIDGFAFSGCRGLTSVTIPSSVTSIGNSVFYYCSGLTSVTIPSSVTSIGERAFYGCSGLTSVAIPNSVTSIGGSAFAGCTGLTNVVFECKEQPSTGDGVFSDTPANLCVYVNWDEKTYWHDREIIYAAESGHNNHNVSVTVTNVIVHYVTNSKPSDEVIPDYTAGILNIIAEVDASKAVSISPEWAAQYPTFASTFDSDFSKALMMETGKKDGAGNPMLVWQDYVAGTDPTKKDEVFTASITFDKDTGVPVISWSPELKAAEAAKRTYRKFGKVKLMDAWAEIPSGHEADYNFFKVSVEMK